MIAEHYQLAEQVYGPELCCRQMRKFGIKKFAAASGVAGGARCFHRGAAAAAGQWQAVLDAWYVEDLPGRHPALEVDETADCEAA